MSASLGVSHISRYSPLYVPVTEWVKYIALWTTPKDGSRANFLSALHRFEKGWKGYN